MVSPRIRVIDSTAKTPDRKSSSKRAALHSPRVLPKNVTRRARVATLMHDQPSSGTTVAPITTRAMKAAPQIPAGHTGSLRLLAGSSSNATSASVVQKGRAQAAQRTRKPSCQFQTAPLVSIIPLAPAMYKSAVAQQPQASTSALQAFSPIKRAPAAKKTVRTRVMPSPSPPPRKRQTAPCRFKAPEHRVSPPSTASHAVSAPSTATKSSQTMDAASSEKVGPKKRHNGRKRAPLQPRQRRPTGIRTAGVQKKKKKEPATKQLAKWTKSLQSTDDAAPQRTVTRQTRHSGRKRASLQPRERRPTGIRAAAVQKKKKEEAATKQLEKWTNGR
ncbi:serine/arginine repetitive matrix protein 1-like [Paramacrobiotus metropolitanus]|uniref:serine/arginine repetitive matrix protein 1-like n=1 Tax=Paramacrobiotus metropolitanus TaxID=2943436 RepID=UPI0024460F8C|nr:serine/arginine repetitive matrix protein 1-like [Paramacrobiotus metropolitanus]